MTTELAEVQTQAPVADPEQAAPPTENTAAQTDESTQAEQKTFTQAELDAIVQTRLAKQERQALKRERELMESLRPQQQPPQQEQNARPARDKFATDDEWVEAVTDWKLDQRDRASQQQRQQETLREQAKKTDKLYTEAAKHPGFDRDTFESLPLTPVIAHAITDSDIAPQLMAHMSANPDLVERIAKLSPARQAAEIGRLEEKLSAPKPVQVPPQPIERVKGGGPVQNSDLSKLPIEQYIERRKAMGARWHRG